VSKDFVKNFKEGKTKFGPVEIHLTKYFILKVTEIPRSGECYFKAKKIEKHDWCQDMLKPEFKGAELIKGASRTWILEEYDRFLFLIQKFFTCEGRYIWIQQYHFKLLLHFIGKKEIDLPFFLFMSLQRMITRAQRKPEKLEKLIFHHGLINLIVLEQLKKEGKDWSNFLFVSNYQVNLPSSPPKNKKPRKQATGSSTTAVT